LATEKYYHSIAFPLIGAGTGGFLEQKTLDIIRDESEQSTFDGEIIIIQYEKKSGQPK
jgi:hypothetical protein